jgi:RNA polymerase sigma-70 factor, ECF subfamily
VRVNSGVVSISPVLRKRATPLVRQDAPSIDFDALYQEFSPKIAALASKHLKDPALVADVVQETFLRAYRSRNRYNPRRAPLPWLQTICMNICYDILREKRRSGRISERPILCGENSRSLIERGSDPAEVFLMADEARTIETALKGLDDQHRKVIVLRLMEGWSWKDIAEVERTSQNAIKCRLQRARCKFKEEYSQITERGALIFWPVLTAPIARLRSRFARSRTQAGFLAQIEALGGFVSVFSNAFAAAALVSVVLIAGSGFSPTADLATLTDSITATSDKLSPAGMNPTAPTLPVTSQSGWQMTVSFSSKDVDPNTPAASVAANAQINKGEQASLKAKLDSKLGDNHSPYLGFNDNVYCDSGRVARAECDVINLMP